MTWSNQMLTGRRNSLQNPWRLAFNSTIAALHTLSADERTRSTWAKAIESYPAVPDVYKDFFTPPLVAGQTFPYTVLTPFYKGFFHTTTKQLVCDLGDAIYILERAGDTVTVQCYPLGAISYLEVGTILLESWIKIGTSPTGAHLDFVFQASAKPEIDRILDQFGSLAPAAADWGDETRSQFLKEKQPLGKQAEP
jgi:hypothetical protein